MQPVLQLPLLHTSLYERACSYLQLTPDDAIMLCHATPTVDSQSWFTIGVRLAVGSLIAPIEAMLTQALHSISCSLLPRSFGREFSSFVLPSPLYLSVTILSWDLNC